MHLYHWLHLAGDLAVNKQELIDATTWSYRRIAEGVKLQRALLGRVFTRVNLHKGCASFSEWRIKSFLLTLCGVVPQGHQAPPASHPSYWPGHSRLL